MAYDPYVGMREPQPRDPARIPAWLDDLAYAAIGYLPEQLTLDVPWHDQSVRVVLDRQEYDFEPAEYFYVQREPLELPAGPDAAPRVVPAEGIRVISRHVSVRGMPEKVCDELTDAVQSSANQSTARSVLLANDLLRVVRVRQRSGERAIRNGGHDSDIAELQRDLTELGA